MPDQLAFEWPSGVARGADDFFVSQANAKAYAMLQTPDLWPERKLVLVGPPGSGKSHLAGIFATTAKALLLDARNLPADLHPSGSTVVIEDMEHLPRASEEAVFHLHNNLRASDGTLLLTASRPPARWPIALPDLASRMQAATVIEITDPDDALLAALIMKLFADRQIMPKPDLAQYLATRIERSYAAAARIVAALDAAALAQGRAINRALAADLLDKQG